MVAAAESEQHCFVQGQRKVAKANSEWLRRSEDKGQLSEDTAITRFVDEKTKAKISCVHSHVSERRI